LRKLVSIHLLHSGGCDSLHFIVFNSSRHASRKRLKPSNKKQGLNIFITGGYLFTSALVLALAYTACQDDRGMRSTFLVFQIPAPWIPYAMILMTLLMDGPGAAKIQGTGLIAAHLHDFLTRLWPTFGGGRNLVPTPNIIKRLFHVDGPLRRTYGTAFAPASSASASGSSAGVLPESWRSRGSGHRLGGN
jgi:Derlin-2/3